MRPGATDKNKFVSEKYCLFFYEPVAIDKVNTKLN